MTTANLDCCCCCCCCCCFDCPASFGSVPLQPWQQRWTYQNPVHQQSRCSLGCFPRLLSVADALLSSTWMLSALTTCRGPSSIVLHRQGRNAAVVNRRLRSGAGVAPGAVKLAGYEWERDMVLCTRTLENKNDLAIVVWFDWRMVQSYSWTSKMDVHFSPL
jgi:hypothetical protein